MAKVPKWFKKKTLKKEVKRILKIEDKETREASLKMLVEKVKSLPSIRNCKIDEKTGKFEVIEYKGLTRTSLGGDFGSENAVRFQTGWANYFHKGETFSLVGRMTQKKAPSLSISFIAPVPKETDFRRDSPYQKYEFSLNASRKTVHNHSTDTTSLKITKSAGVKPFESSIFLSSVMQQKGESPSVILDNEPCPYFKFGLNVMSPASHPAISNQLTLGAIATKEAGVYPYVKCNAAMGYKLPFGLSVSATGGLISALRPKEHKGLTLKGMWPIPYTEKFFIGGVPVARGIPEHKFGYSVDDMPKGCDVYASATIQESLLLFPQYQLNGHLFLSGTIGKNFNSFFPDSCDPEWSVSSVVGAGLTFVQGPVQVEANIQTGIFQKGAEHEILSYQFGITPIQ